MHNRMNQLFYNGHIVDKMEVLVLGGEQFIRDIYFAANTFMQGNEKRDKHRSEIKSNWFNT